MGETTILMSLRTSLNLNEAFQLILNWSYGKKDRSGFLRVRPCQVTFWMMLGVSCRTRGMAVTPTLVLTTELVRVQLAHSLRTRFICAVIVKLVADVTLSSSVKSPLVLEVCAEN